MVQRTKVRLGRNSAQQLEAVRNGTFSCDDWDMEELLRGQRRAKNGRFVGARPTLIPRAVHDELARRVKNDVAHQLRGIAAQHIEPVLRQVMENPGGIAPENVPGLTLQLKAAQDLMDRFVVGKQERVEVSGTLQHETIIENVTIDRTLELDDPDIVDAELVDEDDDWEE